MVTSEVNEKIKVAALFEENRVSPKWFYWGREKHVVEKVEHTWRSRCGETPLLYFSVSDGVNLFEICLNQKTLEWVLERVHQEG